MDPKYTWNLESVYSSLDAWESDYRQVVSLLPEMEKYKGTLAQSADRLLACLQLRDQISALAEQLLVFARMRKDEDNTNSTYQGLSDRASGLYTRVASTMAFIVPEILAIPPETLTGYVEQLEGLTTYRHYLDNLMRQQEHVLSPEMEELLAKASDLARVPDTAFSMLYDADLRFPEMTDEQGNKVELTKSRYLRFIESPDRRVRQEAFETLYGTLGKFQNTFAATLSGQVKANIFFARARKYHSAREAALADDNIPLAVYDNLVETVNRNLGPLHRYIALRKKMLGLDELHMYDLYVPLVKEVSREIPYQQAVETVLESLSPLGEEYLSLLCRGLKQDRWVDVYENQGKTGGAYSWGAYTTQPFILMNWQDRLDDMFTLTHEAGHSMHSLLTRRTQPYVYGHYTTFVAEVASTLNEALLTHYLLKRTDDKAMRMYLLNHYMEGFRTTLYRQTMFAEFEQAIHARAEADQPLTPEALNEIHWELNQRYYGDGGVFMDPQIAMEWSRIPHFYMNFYVFQYATGISAAAALAQQILQEGQPAVDRYLAFLRGGSASYPIDLLRAAGVDMASPEPIQQALNVFAGLVDEMEKLA